MKLHQVNELTVLDSEAPSSPYFVDSRNEVPLKSEFKPTMKVLSRKPAPKLVARKDPSSGIDQLTLEDEEDDDEESRPPTLTMEERQQRAQREREEKQKKYEEVRERLFGALDGTVGASSSSGNTSPPTNRDVKSRGRSKGAKESRSSSSAGIKSRQLYDPNDPVKQDSLTVQKKDQQTPVSGHSTPSEDQLLRQPKGPDGSGRGGFGFEGRGGTTT